MRNARTALDSLVEHWQRAVLSATGVMVATVAVVLLVSIGVGVQADVGGQVRQFGAGLIVVPGHVEVGTFNPNLAGKSFLSDQAADEVLRVPGVTGLAKLSFAGGSVKAGKEEAFPLIVAVSPEWFKINKSKFAYGTAFGAEQGEQSVCVLASVAAKALFPGQAAVGRRVTINEHEYRVVGVTQDAQGENSLFSMQSMANVTYVPLGYVRSVEEDVQINRFFVQTDPSVEPKALVGAVKEALGKHLDSSQFSVLTQEDLLGLMFSVLSILTTLVAGLTSIALFVGGVGILSVMLMSVSERAKEIGVRMAVGARRSDIFWQFLTEALVISVGGVVVGLAVSGVAILGLASLTKIKPLLTPGTVALAFGMGVGIGCFFGLLPALRAARQDPVASLRNE